MDYATLIVILYGGFNIVGGIVGYVKAKSSASLIAGSGSGIVLLSCASAIGKGNLWALLVSFSVALLLGVRFFRTWLKNRRLMPDLLMILFSLATLISVLFR